MHSSTGEHMSVNQEPPMTSFFLTGDLMDHTPEVPPPTPPMPEVPPREIPTELPPDVNDPPVPPEQPPIQEPPQTPGTIVVAHGFEK
jgi:hypothetical protein